MKPGPFSAMFKQVADAVRQMPFLLRDGEQNKRDIATLKEQLAEANQLIRQLAVEIQRTSEREQREREKFTLKIESVLLRLDRPSPPGKQPRQLRYHARPEANSLQAPEQPAPEPGGQAGRAKAGALRGFDGESCGRASSPSLAGISKRIGSSRIMTTVLRRANTNGANDNFTGAASLFGSKTASGRITLGSATPARAG